jgi:hypothetical protein
MSGHRRVLKFTEIVRRRECGIPKRALHATFVCACVLASSAAQAHPFGDYRFLQWRSNYAIKPPVVVYEDEYDDDFFYYHEFEGGSTGIAMSYARDETRDVDGALSSQDYYAIYAESKAPWDRKNRSETHLDQSTKFRKCSDAASLTLTITQMFIRATDGGPYDLNLQGLGDYILGIEPANVPQLVGSVDMEVIAHRRATRFFHAHGRVALNLFVHREGEERWMYAPFSLANSAGDFWQGAQLELRGDGIPEPPTQTVVYELTAPHRIAVDLSAIPTASSCPDEGEPPPVDETGEFTLQVKLKARAESFFFTAVEKSGIEVWIRDPADLDNNEAGIHLEAHGLQRAGKPDSVEVPAATDLVPDPDCVAPEAMGASHE